MQDQPELYREIELRMKGAVDHFHEELKQLRTGRASVAILEGIMVDYYGSATPLNQLATLSVPEPTLIMIQPFDPGTITGIEKAIMNSSLGLNPSNDGKVIRVPVPTLTEDRRKEIVKVAHGMAEESRNGVRQARRDGNDTLKKWEREKEISQDDEHRGYDEMQKLHDHYIGEINTSLEHKEEQILQV